MEIIERGKDTFANAFKEFPGSRMTGRGGGGIDLGSSTIEPPRSSERSSQIQESRNETRSYLWPAGPPSRRCVDSFFFFF